MNSKVDYGCYIETEGLDREVIEKIEKVFIEKFGVESESLVRGLGGFTKLFAGGPGNGCYYNSLVVSHEYPVTVEDVLGIDHDEDGYWKEITEHDVGSLKEDDKLRVVGILKTTHVTFKADDGDGCFFIKGELPDGSSYFTNTDWDRWTVEVWVGDEDESQENHEFKNMKFRVRDEEHSKQIQETLFSLGYKWLSGGSTALYTNSPYLYSDDHGALLYGEAEEGFTSDEFREEHKIEPVGGFKVVPVNPEVPAKKMTKEEIEEILGYKVDIVSEG